MQPRPIEILADEIYKEPQVYRDLLVKHGYIPSRNNTTLYDINAAFLLAIDDDNFAADVDSETGYYGFVGITATLVMTGISIYQTYRQTKSNRSKEIAENLMRVRQNLKLTKEQIQKEANTERRKILTATIIEYNQQLKALKTEEFKKNAWAVGIVVFSSLSAILAYRIFVPKSK